MSDTTKSRRNGPPALAELAAARTDYEDVPVPSLGGKVLRVYALSGTARALLLAPMVDLATISDDAAGDPATIERVFMFQIRVVGASMGYSAGDWSAIGDALGESAIEQLFEVAQRMSRLDDAGQAEATERLQPARSTASGTD